MTLEHIHWDFLSFNELGTMELYRILKARTDVFTIEQKCLYQDLDELDFESHHLIAWGAKDKKTVAGYLRLVFPGVKYVEPAITRVITLPPYRGIGLGKELIKRCLQQAKVLYPDKAIRLSAEEYLEKLYANFGFETVSDPYDKTGIPHIDMLLKKV